MLNVEYAIMVLVPFLLVHHPMQKMVLFLNHHHVQYYLALHDVYYDDSATIFQTHLLIYLQILPVQPNQFQVFQL